MKKYIFRTQVLAVVLGVLFTVGAFCCIDEESSIFQVNEGRMVPVFCTDATEFEYEVGFKGMNCYELDTVLLPGFYVKIVDKPNEDVFKVRAKLDGSYEVSGYIHRNFFKDGSMTSCSDIDFDTISGTVQILPVNDMVKKAGEILSKKAPFCWGCASLDQVPLDSLYTFHLADISKNVSGGYICRGFDCSGLLYYLSNGYLPHSTKKIIDFCKKYGRVISCVSCLEEVSRERLGDMIRSLKDTDLVCYNAAEPTEAHVIMAYKFGFIEGNENIGMVRTARMEAEARLAAMLKRAALLKTDLYILRWHPDLLKRSK